MSTQSSGGIGIGTVIAVVLSWSQWHSVLWAFLHGIFGWLYIILWACGVTASAPF